ncbi:hypothetical protein [Promicromonospora sp. NPDC023805]|uniref:hypothetical protein n=1 Tax=Promicromonospora sp. NPDC023805 TaxID=3154696 RepID=UPI00340AAAFF
MSRHRSWALVAGLAAVLLLTTACGGSNGTDGTGGRGDGMSEESAIGEKFGDGELRTDLEPLTKRFSALGTPVGAEWMGGTLGDAPGPTTYWIDAVIEVDPAVADELRSTYAPEAASTPPDVVSGIQDKLPAGTLLSSDALDSAVAGGGFATDVYVAQDEPFVVLAAYGSSS